MTGRLVKPKSCAVLFVGDNVESITVLNQKKSGKKKDDIIYDFLRAENLQQEFTDDIYKPSKVLGAEQDEETDEIVQQYLTPTSKRRTKQVENILNDISSPKRTPSRKSLKFSSPKGTPNKKKNQNILSPKVTPNKKYLKVSSPKGTPSKSILKTPTSKKKKLPDSTTNDDKSGYSLRQRLKQISLNDNDEDSDLENSDDDDVENSDDELWDEDGSDMEEDYEATPLDKTSPKKKKKTTTFAEDYFSARKQSKTVTSNRTMSKVTIPQTNVEELNKICRSTKEYHKNERIALNKNYQSMYQKWSFLLHEGFGVLLYGVGSKFSLLQHYCKTVLEEELYIEINGFFPSLTTKQILNSITEDIMENNDTFPSFFEHADHIKQYFQTSNEKLYIIIHNIDGPALRGTKTQSILSYLAASSNIHFVASVDHINCSLIWDQVMLSNFKWVWYDVTTYEPYIFETSYENSLLRNQSSHLLLSSLLHVFQSLTPNGRGVFLILAKYQMEKKNVPGFSGLTFQDWYQECREAFLVNSELTMNAQLSEFKNHKLLASRKSIDGIECWYIPVDENTLSQFLAKEDS